MIQQPLQMQGGTTASTDAGWYNSLKEKISELSTAGIAMENFDESFRLFSYNGY